MRDKLLKSFIISTVQLRWWNGCASIANFMLQVQTSSNKMVQAHRYFQFF